MSRVSGRRPRTPCRRAATRHGGARYGGGGEPRTYARGRDVVELPSAVDRCGNVARGHARTPRPGNPDLGRELGWRAMRRHARSSPTRWAPRPRRGVPVRSRLRRTAVCVRPVSSPTSRSDRPAAYCSATNRSNLHAGTGYSRSSGRRGTAAAPRARDATGTARSDRSRGQVRRRAHVRRPARRIVAHRHSREAARIQMQNRVTAPLVIRAVRGAGPHRPETACQASCASRGRGHS